MFIGFRKGLLTSCNHFGKYKLDFFRMELNWIMFSKIRLKVQLLQARAKPLSYTRTGLN